MPTPGTVEFPTALDGVVSLFEVNNRAYTTLSADINNSVLTIPLTDSTVFPATGVVTLTDSLTAPTKHEEIIFTANAANSLTVPVGGRGAFGTTARNWSGTVHVRMRYLAKHHEVLRDAIIAVQTYLLALSTKFIFGETPTGSVNGANATFTSQFNFVPESVVVLVNGLEQWRVIDFNTSGTQTIILSDAPLTGESVRVNYIIP